MGHAAGLDAIELGTRDVSLCQEQVQVKATATPADDASEMAEIE